MNSKDRASIEKQVEKTIAEITSEAAMRARVQEAIEGAIRKGVQAIALNAIGMEQRWNDWEVDHCNGRRTEIANELAKSARHFTETLIAKTKFGLSKSETAKITSALRSQYIETLRYTAKNIVEQRARADAEQFVTNVVESKLATGEGS